jgi:hypothetical protein
LGAAELLEGRVEGARLREAVVRAGEEVALDLADAGEVDAVGREAAGVEFGAGEQASFRRSSGLISIGLPANAEKLW